MRARILSNEDLRQLLSIQDENEKKFFINEMSEFCGKFNNFIHIEKELYFGFGYIWHQSWLEEVESPTIEDYEEANRIIEQQNKALEEQCEKLSKVFKKLITNPEFSKKLTEK